MNRVSVFIMMASVAILASGCIVRTRPEHAHYHHPHHHHHEHDDVVIVHHD